jgi:hypothetical protein
MSERDPGRPSEFERQATQATHGLVREMTGFIRQSGKWWLVPRRPRARRAWSLRRPLGDGGGALHLRALLTGAPCRRLRVPMRALDSSPVVRHP